MTRIIGGRPAEKNEYPWMVVLVDSENYTLCGGSLITSRTVLSAAHCRTPAAVSVKDHDLSKKDGEQVIKVIRFIRHPKYTDEIDESPNFDFALAHLFKRVQYSNILYPVCLPRPRRNYEQREVVTTGWGIFDLDTGDRAKILQEVELRTITNLQCITDTVYSKKNITPATICARAPGKDSCIGDSGGPLLAYEGGRRYFSVIGVTSFGEGCAFPDAPGVYARVSKVLKWIRKYMLGGTCRRPLFRPYS